MARYLALRILLSTQTITADDKATMPEYSDMVIVFVCLLCALVCVVGVLGVVRWTCLKRPFPSISTTTTTTTTTVDKNSTPSEFFKKKIVESLPRLTYKSSQSMTTSDDNNATPVPVLVPESGESECVICLSEFIDGDEIRVLPRCKHVFHVACIDTWLIGSHTFGCPSCRQTLVVKQCQKCKVDGSINSVSLPTQPEADYLP